MNTLKKLFREHIRKELKDAYELGLEKGYELGRLMARSEITNKGFITGLEVNRQLNEIMKKTGF